MSNINVLIDNLHKKIIAYKKLKEKLKELIIEKDFIQHQLETLKAGGFEEADHLLIEKNYQRNALDIEYQNDEIDIALYATKFDAYRLGRTRPRMPAEP